MRVKNAYQVARFDPDKMQKINLFESRRMFCDVYCLEPGQQQAPHTHENNDKIYCVLQGEGQVTVGPHRHRLGGGDAVCAWAGQSHGVKNVSNERLVCLVFMAPHPQPESVPR